MHDSESMEKNVDFKENEEEGNQKAVLVPAPSVSEGHNKEETSVSASESLGEKSDQVTAD